MPVFPIVAALIIHGAALFVEAVKKWAGNKGPELILIIKGHIKLLTYCLIEVLWSRKTEN